MKRKIFSWVLVATVLILGSCAAGQLNEEGKKLETAGDPWGAANKYVGALNHDDKLVEAKQGLLRTAKAAYEQQLSRAQSAEDAQDFGKAAGLYGSLDRFLVQARAHQAARFKSINASAKSNEMKGAAADQEYQLGEQLMTSRTWPGAVQAFERAEKFIGGPFRDSRELMARSYAGWSVELFDDGAFRESALKAIEAGKIEPHNRLHNERAASIHLALGRHFVFQGLCRQALQDFDFANRVVPSSVPRRDVADAEECARVLVSVPPFENRTRQRLRGFALEESFGDRLGARLGTSTSDFVRIVERGATRVRVIGKITQFEITRDNRPRVENGSVAFTSARACKEGEKPPCVEEGFVRYRRHEAAVRIRVSGFIKAVDEREQLAQFEFDENEEDSILYIDGLTLDPDEIKTLTLAEEIDLLALKDARQELRTDPEMAAAIVDRVVEAAAAALGPAIDQERPARDPRTLSLEPLGS